MKNARHIDKRCIYDNPVFVMNFVPERFFKWAKCRVYFTTEFVDVCKKVRENESMSFPTPQETYEGHSL